MYLQTSLSRVSGKKPKGKNSQGTCELCLNSIRPSSSSQVQSMNVEDVHKICRQYLHSGIFKDNSSSFKSDGTLSSKYLFCQECIQSTSELAVLQEKLDLVQKTMTELAFMFSLGILHRRGKYADEENEKESDNYVAVKKLVSFDVSALPNCSSWDNSKENSPTVFEQPLISDCNYRDERNDSADMSMTSQDHYTTVQDNLNAETNPLWMFHNENDDASFENNSVEEPCSYSGLQSEPIINVPVKLENLETDLEGVQHCESFPNPLAENMKSEFVPPPFGVVVQCGIVNNTLSIKKRPKKEQLSKHRLEHTKKSIGKQNVTSQLSRLQCHICQQRFAQPYTLKRHIEYVHEKVRRYQCSLCNKRFRQNYDMVLHFRRVHK